MPADIRVYVPRTPKPISREEVLQVVRPDSGKTSGRLNKSVAFVAHQVGRIASKYGYGAAAAVFAAYEYSSLKVKVGTVKKSNATITSRSLAKNAFQQSPPPNIRITDISTDPQIPSPD
jgi:hypothetical protein